MNKIKVGIDINEILRAKWLQYDRFYVQEFGEDSVDDDQPYVYDLFKNYKWEDVEEEIKELKEPDEMPDDINPTHFQVDKNGDAEADIFLFKKTETKKLTAKQVYNRFMYEDYVFEIHASAPIMYKGMDLHVNEFLLKYENVADFTLLSVENRFSIPSTLFFLSRMTSRFKNICFVDKAEDMWKHVDVLITTDPEILDAGTPDEINKHVIKLQRPYNKECQDGSLGLTGKEILQLNDLTGYKEGEEENPKTKEGREKFQKIINYNPKN